MPLMSYFYIRWHLIISVKMEKKSAHTESKRQKEASEFLENLPFSLTGAQKKVYEEICADMEGGFVMNRLVQGDVGSGKTIVAVLALLEVVKNGYQGAFMVPTEVLAAQHYQNLTKLLADYGVTVGLLSGSLTAKRKETGKRKNCFRGMGYCDWNACAHSGWCCICRFGTCDYR